MTTGPMGKLYVGDKIDGAWEVEDIFWQSDKQIFVLRRLFDGIMKYLDTDQLRQLFIGDRAK